MKVAFSGSSGSGKTTLVNYVAKEFNLRHISGSSGDLLNDADKEYLSTFHGYSGGYGHLGVIQKSSIDVNYGVDNQTLIMRRRAELIANNDNFVTDRSPLDNLTYFISQVGFHPSVNDYVISQFAHDCLISFYGLTHLIFVRAVQPDSVENNGSRIHNKWYQRSSDAQFDYWLRNYFMKEKLSYHGEILQKPKILGIDFWDLEKRKELVKHFLEN